MKLDKVRELPDFWLMMELGHVGHAHEHGGERCAKLEHRISALNECKRLTRLFFLG